MNSWIGFDLDGTLARHELGQDATWTEGAIGSPVEPMMRRLKRYLRDGYDVRILTARVGRGEGVTDEFIALQRKAIEDWCYRHVGRVLPVTAEKNHQMIVFFDDRAITVQRDTGKVWWEFTPDERIQEIAV